MSLILRYNLAKAAFDLASRHQKKINSVATKFPALFQDLYRIYFYDCLPYQNKDHNPLSRRCIDFSKTPQATLRLDLFKELKKTRKLALRLGHLEKGDWEIDRRKTRDLLKGKIQFEDLAESDLKLSLRQKGVDIKIGLDIASLSYKSLVKTIVLVSGDCDFVPAAKLARREGIDFILDPLWNPIDSSLFEHIDGLATTWPKPSYL